jgi:uncharacterized membrane protein YkoI
MADPRISILTLVLGAVVAGGVSVGIVTDAAAAQSAATPAEAGRPTTHATSDISLDQAVKMAEQKFKARVVRAESQQVDGHTVYVLRLLNDSGRVWTVRVDAASGTVM